MNNRLDYIVLT